MTNLVLVIGFFAAGLFSAGPLAAAEVALRPYAIDWKENSAPLVDASRLLDAPAGKHGFITARGGHLATAAGRFRFWGMNITMAANEPSKADAPMVAAYLARHGINCVRMHFLDRPAPQGLLDGRRADTQAFDPGQLDRLDFFVAELKKRGIYIDLNLNVGRTYKAGDQVRDFEFIGFAKALTYFDPRLLELQRDYARQLLTHRNPYTGNRYSAEPAVALVELVNENSIVESWVADRLLGQASRKNPGTWTDIPASYERDLTERYQQWLKQRGEVPVPRLRKREFAAADARRFRNEAAFYMEMEDRYFQSMAAFLKDDLGVKSLILGTSDHNHGMSGYPLLASTSRLDVVDGHVYWQHPRYITDPATGRTTGFTIGNTPMVDDPTRSTVVQLSRSAVAGKPYIVSEVNHPFPAEFAAEGVPILAAYAAFQDWDGIFWYTFEHHLPEEWQARVPGHFEFRSDPVKMTQVAAGAFFFLRGDVRAAEQTVGRGYTREQVLDSLRLPGSAGPYFTPGFPPHLPLEHASRIFSFTRASEAPAATPTDPIVADTKELAWYGKPGLVAIDTGRTQALIGFTGERRIETRHLAVKLDNRFAAVLLVSLDGAPVARSRSLVLSTGARTANSGMEWNAARTSLLNWGTAPTVIEPVTGTVTLRGIERAKSVNATPLDGSGRAAAEPVAARRTAAGWEFQLGATATPWYRIAIE